MSASSSAAGTASGVPARPHQLLADVLLGLAVVLGIVAMIGTALRYEVFHTQSFDETSRQLIANDAIRSQVASTLVDQAFAEVDVEAAIGERLPTGQKGLAAPIATVVQSAAPKAVDELLARPRVQALFVDAASKAQAIGVGVLENDALAAQVVDGWIVLDLGRTAREVADAVPLLRPVADRISPEGGRIRIVQARRLERAQTATGVFRASALVLPWVVLTLLAGSVWLARGNRRRQLGRVGVAIVASGVIVVVLRAIAGRYVVDALVATDAVRPAAQATWNILTRLLVDGAWTAVIIGSVLLAGVWLTGDRGAAVALRRRIAPRLARRESGYAAVVGTMLLLVWWEPTAAFGRPFSILVLGLLLALGYEALRGSLLREQAGSPAPTSTPAPAG